MARPSSLSIIPVPQHQFPGLAITQKDFRLNFCINNGSKSMPSMVPIYSPDYLDELLDEVGIVRMFLYTVCCVRCSPASAFLVCIGAFSVHSAM